jgi:hypothetical protein
MREGNTADVMSRPGRGQGAALVCRRTDFQSVFVLPGLLTPHEGRQVGHAEDGLEIRPTSKGAPECVQLSYPQTGLAGDTLPPSQPRSKEVES